METFFVILNIAVLAGLAVLLYIMQKRHVSFSKRVFTALGLGILLGGALQWIYTSESEVVSRSMDWYSLLGSGYVGLLQMIVIPLIMVSIITAIMNIKGGKKLGKISASVLITLVLTTAIAAAVGIASAMAFGLNAEDLLAGQGEAEIARGESLESRLGDVEGVSLPEQILSFIPTNPFADMTGARPSSTLAVVIFSAFIGLAVLGLDRKNAQQAETFRGMINAVHGVVMRIVTMILRLTPYGILALIAKMMATTDPAGIARLAEFVVASYVALIVMFVIHLVILLLFGMNPVTYAKKVVSTLIFAFTSRSSAATIPLNIETQTKKLGVSEGVANLSASFGATIGQNGCAGIYPAMLAVMIAPAAGVEVNLSFILTLIAVVAISSFGVAGVGGGATFAALIVLSTMNLPVALAGLLIAVEPLIDMGRTALNVNDSMVAGVVTGKVTGEIDKKTFDSAETPELETASA
ncbi:MULTISPECIES: L-cystine transporter [Saccharibacillus]|uniref:L-cystine uptake protein TcyP n=1 Tax=Saccharibacillus brassicae TaxID=2583377 RepID=A0A4Y6V0W2_SACBS|nr:MULTISPECIES: L-cystine transporter [Saccharibacillus]MWJ31077.1 cation:dicarboxylase symporter family transporter [Saccharibacillus sp. WB 17]QDH22438.1 L-cystine transporter [Saccharibacillus brassicae]